MRDARRPLIVTDAELEGADVTRSDAEDDVLWAKGDVCSAQAILCKLRATIHRQAILARLTLEGCAGRPTLSCLLIHGVLIRVVT